MPAPLRIAMVAGEASGDLLASHLIRALQQHVPDAQFFGIGGPKMQAAGFRADWPAEKLAVRGYAEVLRHYREIAGIRRQLLNRLLADPPDVFIGVDAPDFNLWLERRVKAAGIRSIHFVSPSVWAWRGGRIAKMARAVHQVLCLFPFEPALYAGTGVQADYVGHPLADVIPLEIDLAAARERLGLMPDRMVFALLPGSRQSELQYMARTFIETAKLLHQRFPQARFLVPLASRETRTLFETELWRSEAQELPMTLLFGHAQEAMAAADGILVASGTATLEAALMKKPLVIAYKMSPASWRIMRNMGYQPWVGLPNILAQRFAVPEFLQDEATAENLAQALGNAVCDNTLRERLHALFTEIHLLLRQNTAEQAAAAILPALGRHRRRDPRG
ncbi:tetraacyldisaccharide-1-P synthase [Sterolibacterium denitrificans]|uniref:Lipid-A-disaccharide synthase n=1 Tax=Sterolibacterium denitrificans TaxID=157592 RepID=A0A7Z7MV18_9PROT|nr:lipid-A-disaccharide synthase [Sterolibacterium denitrificans]SMB25738.1 tetraacyldisaccharide-1-P synthase [Sterolibacterium denitrificans]